MLRRLFGIKSKPPTLPPSLLKEYGAESSTIPTSADSTSTLSVYDVVDDNFDEVVLKSRQLAVVDFWAEWCQPCTIISAYTDWLLRDYGEELLVAALDTDENPAIPERYAIMGLPTLLFLRDGVEVDRQVGLCTYEELQAKVEALLA
jgi:thioredoxin 1